MIVKHFCLSIDRAGAATLPNAHDKTVISGPKRQERYSTGRGSCRSGVQLAAQRTVRPARAMERMWRGQTGCPPLLTIYAPVNLTAPCITLFIRASPLWGGLGPGTRDICGWNCSSRLASAIWGPQISGILFHFPMYLYVFVCILYSRVDWF